MDNSDKAAKINIETAKKLLPNRPIDSNKGTFGKVLTIAGCFNYQGAAYLTAVSSLKIGAGLVSLSSIKKVIDSISALTPNLTFYPLQDFENTCIGENAFTQLEPIIKNYNVIAIGPGLSEHPQVQKFVKKALERLSDFEIPIVIDADALNLISDSNITKLPKNSIITPHPKELSRLLNTTVEEIQKDRIAAAKIATEKYNCVTVLKGNKTVVCSKNYQISVNTSGNSALAKAGSGDVLTGIIAGLISQGMQIEDAAKLGVFIHGLSGEAASENLTQYCVLAQDLIDHIPEAIKRILN